MHDGRVVGCLCIANQHARDFSAQEHELLAGIAAQAAHAIETARQIETAGTRATTAERGRLAREMHDTLAQMLGFVNIKTQAAREFLAQGQYDQAKTQLDQLSKLAQELYADTRELILGLHSETGPERGLVPALEEYTRQFDELSGIHTTFNANDLAELTLAPATEVQLIRVVQEALSNVRKHAHANRASVHFERNGDSARVEIVDDGQGFDPSSPSRGQFPKFGLTSMRERVESLGGTFTLESAAARGTKVQIEFPLVYRGEN
jgi:signal transduction histidine kinase